jgi:transcriptional antiterminator NusG
MTETGTPEEIGKSHGRQDSKQGRQWYVLHTYSGYEKAVKSSLEQRIESMNMQDKIFDVAVPEETEVILRKGKPVQRKKCVFPGYVLVEMIVTDDSWYVVRNTPNVTGFVGSGNVPVPISPEEYGIIKSRMGTEEPQYKAEFSKNDIVKIIDGPFATHEGVVDEVYPDKGKLRVLVTLFERETPMELAFNQVQKK